MVRTARPTNTYCLISGCCSKAPTWMDILYQECLQREEAQKFREALEMILTPDERAGQEDMTVIGRTLLSGLPIPEVADTLALEDADIRIISGCVTIHIRDMVGPPDFYAADQLPTWPLLVTRGAMMMCHTVALKVLLEATAGRMTALRLWRLAMTLRNQGGDNYRQHKLEGIDYRGISPGSLENPGIPNTEDVLILRRFKTTEIIANEIIHSHGFWLRMRPDRFPISGPAFEPVHVGPGRALVRRSARRVCKIDALPFDITLIIASELPTMTLFSFLRTCKHIRHALLGSVKARDSLAHSWMRQQAPWYLPPSGSSDVTDVVPSTERLGWSYLNRCWASGSMRNRGRIYLISEDIERLAEKTGV